MKVKLNDDLNVKITLPIEIALALNTVLRNVGDGEYGKKMQRLSDKIESELRLSDLTISTLDRTNLEPNAFEFDMTEYPTIYKDTAHEILEKIYSGTF